MGKFFNAVSGLFADIMFGKQLRCAVLRSAVAFGFAFLVVFDPFSAAFWFRVYLYVFCSGTLLLVFCRLKPQRKTAILFLTLFAVGIAALYYGRGDSVSGVGIALFCAITAITLFFSGSRRLDRYSWFAGVICGLSALFVSLVIITRCGQLGVRYLDQLHSYALALAGCGFANLMLIKRGDV